MPRFSGMGLVPAAPDLAAVDAIVDTRPGVTEPAAPGVDRPARQQQFDAFGDRRGRRDRGAIPAQLRRQRQRVVQAFVACAQVAVVLAVHLHAQHVGGCEVAFEPDDVVIGTLCRRKRRDAVLDRQFLDALELHEAARAREQSRAGRDVPGQVQPRCELVVGIGAVRLLVPAQAQLGRECIRQPAAHRVVHGDVFARGLGCERARDVLRRRVGKRVVGREVDAAGVVVGCLERRTSMPARCSQRSVV